MTQIEVCEQKYEATCTNGHEYTFKSSMKYVY